MQSRFIFLFFIKLYFRFQAPYNIKLLHNRVVIFTAIQIPHPMVLLKCCLCTFSTVYRAHVNKFLLYYCAETSRLELSNKNARILLDTHFLYYNSIYNIYLSIYVFHEYYMQLRIYLLRAECMYRCYSTYVQYVSTYVCVNFHFI